MHDAPQERQRAEQAAVREAFATLVRRSREQRARQPAPSLAGYLCERCQDAPAVVLHPAPGGGEIGVCEQCATEEHHAEPPR
jgi:hypothetical protein